MSPYSDRIPLLSPIQSKRSLVLDPAPLEKTPPIIEPIDPVQIASVAVVPSKEAVWAKSDDTDITVSVKINY